MMFNLRTKEIDPFKVKESKPLRAYQVQALQESHRSGGSYSVEIVSRNWQLDSAEKGYQGEVLKDI